MNLRNLYLAILALLLLTVHVSSAVITTEEDSQHVKITTEKLITWITKADPTITVTNLIGMIQFQQKTPFDYRVNGTYFKVTGVDNWSVSGDKATINCSTNEGSRKVVLTFDYLSPSCFKVNYQPSAGGTVEQCRESLIAPSTEHFYGLGEPSTGSLDLRGKSVRIWIEKTYPEKGCMVPFLLSTRGYGIWVDSYLDGTFDVANSSTDTLRVLWPAKQLSYYFFYGPGFSKIIDQYTALTGRPPLPPKWQFGFAKWLKPLGTDKNAILQDIQTLQSKDIPMSMTWIEPQWQTHLNSMEFRTDIFPDPAGFISQLHGMGYRIGVWIKTDQFQSSPNYLAPLGSSDFVMNLSGGPWLVQGKHYNYYTNTFVNEDHGFIDYTDSGAITWWQTQIQKALDYGLDGFKIQWGIDIDYNNCKFDSGESGAVVRNKYSYYASKAHFNYLNSKKGNDFFLMSKAECAGSQSYVTLHWPGDQTGDFTTPGLPAAVIGVQSAGLSGFPFWTCDIGGFYPPEPTKEVFVRWTEFSAFTPAMETFHSPWGFDQETEDIFRYFTKLHYELIPYIYSLAYQAHLTGEPIVRPLAYHHRTDQTAAVTGDEFLLGSQILVAPVISAGAASRSVYLPKGRWIDYWDNSTRYEGPGTVTISTPINRIPVFIFSGAIIPMDVVDSTNGHGTTASAGALTLDMYPDGDSSFAIYADNQQSIIKCSLSDKLRIEVPSISQRIILRCKLYRGTPSSVKLNDSELTQYADQSSFDAAGQGWHWLPEGRLLVKYPANEYAILEASW